MYGLVLSLTIIIIVVMVLWGSMTDSPEEPQPAPQPAPPQPVVVPVQHNVLGTFYDPIVPVKAPNYNVPIYYPYNNPFLYGWERYPQSPAWTFGTYSDDGHFGGGQYTYKMP